MKSSFLLTVLLGALVSTQVYGQTKKVTTKTTTTTATTTPVAAEAPKSSFDKFYERLGMSYFAAYTSPSLDKWDTNNAADFDGKQSADDAFSHNLFNQVNFSYNFGAKLKFNIVPRWFIFLDHPSDMPDGSRGLLMLDDTVVGFSGVLYQSADKTFTWFTNPRTRLPTSRGSRNGKDAAFGTLTYQLEWNNAFTYTPNPTWEYGLSVGNRVWIYEDRYNWSRHRLFLNPSITYTINDTTKVASYFEYMLENTRNWKSINGLEPTYKDIWQNFMVGVAHDVTPKFNVMPFVSTFINDIDYGMKSYWVGAWISYSIK